MQYVRCLIVIAIVALAAPANGQSRTREGAALFTPPAGWTRVSDTDGTRYVSADKAASFSVGRAAVVSGTLAAHLDTVLAQAKTLPQFKEEYRQQGDKHNHSGGTWNGALYSFMDSSRNATSFVWVVLVSAGGRAVPVTSTFSSPTDFDKHSPTVLKSVNELSLTTTEVVESGTPSLTRYAIDETTDFVEWLMETPLTEEQRATLETEVRGYWKAGNKKEIDGIVELLDARDQLGGLKPAEREVARQAVIEEALAQWRKDKKSPSAKMLVGIYDAAHKPLAKGKPPLTRQAVDAFAEFLYFAATQAAGTPEVSPPPAIKTQLAKTVTKAYAKMSKDQRELIAQMPILWAVLRASWADLSAAEKSQYVDGWERTKALVELGTALDPSKQVATTKQGGGKVSAAQVQSEAMRNQMALQAQQQHFQMMQQMMRQQFESQMIMNSNLGGNTSYTYRW